MQTALIDSSSIFSSPNAQGPASGALNPNDKLQFEQLLNGDTSKTGVSSEITSVVNYIENKFNEKHVDIVKNLKSFEESGGAVALMAASHQGANNSVMVQLCGTVSKKCADNVEQIYKQQ